MTPIIHEIATGFLKNILETLKTPRAYEMGRDQCKAYEVLQGNDRQVHSRRSGGARTEIEK